MKTLSSYVGTTNTDVRVELEAILWWKRVGSGTVKG